MDEKHKAMLELAAKAIGEARELFAEQRGARAAGPLPVSGPAGAEGAGAASSTGAEPEAEKLAALVDGSGLGWLMENDEERGRFLEELEARLAAAGRAAGS